MTDIPSPDDLAAEVRDRVDERREQGLYPEGLERDLDLHFHHIAVRGVRDRLERLRVAIADADETGRALDAARIGLESGRAPGRLVHRIMAKLTRRQIDGTLAQVREYAETLAEAHRALLLAHADLVSQMDDLRDRFAALEEQGEP